MKKYTPYIKKYWYSFLLGPFFMVLEACGEFLLPYISANIINNGAATGDIGYIIKNGIYMALLAIGMLLAGVLGANFAIRDSARLAAGVRADTFKKIQKFSFSNIDDFTTGSLITRITNDITQIQGFSQTLLRGMFRSPIMLIGALVMSYILNPDLMWVIVFIIPFLALCIFLIIKTASPRYTAMQQSLDSLNNDLAETVTAQRLIKSFVREDYEKEKFGGINNKLVDKTMSALKVMMLMQPVSMLAVNVATIAVVWVAGKQIMVGDMELGTLTAFITYLTQILTALNFLANIILQGTRAAASDRRIGAVLNCKIDLTDDEAKEKELEVKKGTVEFKDVCFKYFKNNHKNVLDKINLKIEAGQTVGIIGSTGSGKTTLVSMIPRLYDPDSGQVLIDGVDVKEYSLENVRRGVSMVLQKNTLFSGSITENLLWGDENATMQEIEEAAKMAQAHGFITALKDGYDTELGRGGVNLSGGQKQRLCIARALLKKPKILILDDSTSAVDTATDAAIRHAFKTKLAGITKIIIAQRITSVMDSDCIIVMDDGAVVGCGTHGELIEDCELYKEIYYSQKDKEEA